MRYKELDALRGIAALLVVFFHFTIDTKQAKLGFELGVTGVDLFFVISGFVIFLSLNKISSVKEFFVNRVSRLFPSYWACVTFTYLVMIITAKSEYAPVVNYLTNMTMLQYYFDIRDLDGGYWTLIVELLFYVFIGLLFFIKGMRYIMPVGMFFVIGIVINDLWLEDAFPSLKGVHEAFPLWDHFPLFMAGIVLYKLFHCEGERMEKTGLYAATIACFASQLLLFDNGGRSQFFISFQQYIGVLGTYLLIFILFVNNRLGFVVTKPTLFLGKISFSLYLIHQFVSTKVIIPNLITNAHIGFWPAILVALTSVLVLATLVNYFIEVPLGKKLNSFLRNELDLEERVR